MAQDELRQAIRELLIEELRAAGHDIVDRRKAGGGPVREEVVTLASDADLQALVGRILALSKDLSVSEFRDDVGFGWVLDEAGGRLEGLRVADVNQEHGMIPVADPAEMARIPNGTRLRILPNHSCATAAAYDRYQVVEGGPEVLEVWQRCRGW